MLPVVAKGSSEHQAMRSMIWRSLRRHRWGAYASRDSMTGSKTHFCISQPVVLVDHGARWQIVRRGKDGIIARTQDLGIDQRINRSIDRGTTWDETWRGKDGKVARTLFLRTPRYRRRFCFAQSGELLLYCCGDGFMSCFRENGACSKEGTIELLYLYPVGGMGWLMTSRW